MFHEGTLLAGKYRVERLLGAGGMGYVMAAVHEQLDQRVAVKMLAPELCENKDAVLRFLREARAAVRIRSEHVARVLDVDELENGAPYMVMEFLSGQDLSHELNEQDRLAPHVAIDYVLQACEAVAEAHSLGIIHRDLKPANLFLTRRADGSPLVKVLDFGISKAITPDTGAAGQSLTAPQSLLGSPSYMSPEQIRRPKTVDIRTDIWSLGTILFEFLIGEPPFRGDTPLSVLAAVVSDPMPSIVERNPAVSADLESVVAKCLEKDPANRHQTVAELAHALAPHAPSAALSSVSRISGILRSYLPPMSPAASTTLRSASGFPPDDAEDRTSEDEVVPGRSEDKHTQTDFGTSLSIPGLALWQTRAAIGFGVGVVAVALVLLVRSPAREPDNQTSTASAAAAATLRPAPVQEAPSAPVSGLASAAVLGVRVDAGASQPRAEGTLKTRVPKNASPGPGKAPTEATSVPHAGAKPPAAHPASDDPLEGRR